MKAIRVLLADDHSLVRAGFRKLLEGLEGIEVVAEAGDGHDALRLIAAQQPDVVLMDIAMPGLNGLEVAARVADQFPRVRVLILSMHLSEEYALWALRARAAGYLLKDAVATELEFAVKAVARGETYLSPRVSEQVVSGYLHSVDGETSYLERLTPRQRETLQLIAEGHSSKKIALLLNISIKTVETHRAALMDRLEIYDVPGLVRYAIRTGLVDAEA